MSRRFPEFEAIFMPHPGTRPVMSKPPKMMAAKALIDQVRWELELPDDVATRVADWVADRMERYAAYTARPVFGMEGDGPQCSLCSMIWPLCGHHHLSAEVDDEDEVEQ